MKKSLSLLLIAVDCILYCPTVQFDRKDCPLPA